MTKDDVRKLVEEVSGCDGTDDYSKGWDDACQAILEALERDCTNCSFEYNCDWTPAKERGYCDSWKREAGEKKGPVLLLRKYVPRPTGTGWVATTCPKCGEECWDRVENREKSLCIDCILRETDERKQREASRKDKM